jgi:peptide/nickel transport system permease protein
MLKHSNIVMIMRTLLVLGFGLVAFLPPLLGLRTDLDLTNMLVAPSLAHPFGTDHLGRDLVVRISDLIRGAVIPLWGVALTSSILGCLLALGLLVAKSRTKTFQPVVFWLQILASLLIAMPISVMVFAWSVWHEQAGLWSVLMALGIFFSLRSMLMIFDLYRQDRGLAFWQAHQVIGGSVLRQIWHYGLMGHWRRSLGQMIEFHLRVALIVEASLSYLGFGLQEPRPSFGNLLSSHFELYLKGEMSVLILIVLAFGWTTSIPAHFVSLLGFIRIRLSRSSHQEHRPYAIAT